MKEEQPVEVTMAELDKELSSLISVWAWTDKYGDVCRAYAISDDLVNRLQVALRTASQPTDRAETVKITGPVYPIIRCPGCGGAGGDTEPCSTCLGSGRMVSVSALHTKPTDRADTAGLAEDDAADHLGLALTSTIERELDRIEKRNADREDSTPAFQRDLARRVTPADGETNAFRSGSAPCQPDNGDKDRENPVEAPTIAPVDETVKAACHAFAARLTVEGWSDCPLGDVDDSALEAGMKAALSTLAPADGGGFQERVGQWMEACFTPAIIADKLERADRFIEESLELVQSTGYSADRAHALVDYVFGRPVGEPFQEVGGVMVTLAALCNPHGLDMDAAAETELARIWTKVEQIRAKQASKPVGSALPIPAALSTPAPEAVEMDWSFEPDLGASTPEPPLKKIIYDYYAEHFDTDKSSELTSAYANAIDTFLSRQTEKGGCEHQSRPGPCSICGDEG